MNAEKNDFFVGPESALIRFYLGLFELFSVGQQA
jgi:hypothetical protein